MEDEKEIIGLIAKNAKMSEKDVLKEIEEKELEFSGMVSREGAIFLIAREHDIDLLEPKQQTTKIKDIAAGMSNVSFFGKVTGIGDIREFKTDKGEGKVASIFLGDETGTIRMSLWNEKTEALSKIKKGDILEIMGAYTKEDNRGSVEARIGKGGNLRKVSKDEGIKIEAVAFNDTRDVRNEAKDFNSAQERDNVSAKAYIVHIYDRQILYHMCPECRKKLQDGSCNEHGKVEPSKFMVLSCILDDGTSTMNAAFFNKGVESILGKSAEEIEKTITEKGALELVKAANLLGQELYVSGFVKKNSFTGRLEISINSAKAVDTKTEINKMVGALGAAPEKQEAA